MRHYVEPTYKNLTLAAQNNSNTTSLNIALGLPGMFSTYSDSQTRKLRIITIVSSCASIVAGFLGIFFLTGIDRRRHIFRHDLILLLLVYDMMKGIVFLIYPVATIIHKHVYGIPKFYNTLGWFTAFTIEGADLVIGIFAIHFALLIFKPSWKWRNRKTGNMEGGLYKVRYFMFPILFLVPALLASLAFINFNKKPKINYNINIVLDNNDISIVSKARVGGYKPWGSWCYLPPKPIWYRIALSWGPRYLLIISIVIIYVSIYVYVRRESEKIKTQLSEFENPTNIKHNSFKKRQDSVTQWPQVNILRPVIQFAYGTKHFFALSVEDPHNKDQPVSFTHSVTQRNEKSDDESMVFSPQQGGLHILRYHHTNGHIVNGTSTASSADYIVPESRTNIDINLSSHAYATEIDHDRDEIPSSYNSETNSNSIFNENIERNRNDENPNHLIPKSSQLGNDIDELAQVRQNFQRETYADLKHRRSQIQRNLRTIFIYPISYVLIWFFPLLLDAFQYSHEEEYGPILWLAYIENFIRPASCLINSSVFVSREKPWRYSWKEVQSKEIMDKYTIKGQIGESDILELCNERLGKRGWYYRGRCRKRECWRHKPQVWKRVLWFFYRFSKGVLFFHGSITFQDNCDDDIFWMNYYNGVDQENITSNRKPIVSNVDAHESDPFDQQSVSTSPGRLSIPQVPLLWRAIHNLPMLSGIDLDELDRQLRIKYKDDDFIIPGLEFILDTNASPPGISNVTPNSNVDASCNRSANEIGSVKSIRVPVMFQNQNIRASTTADRQTGKMDILSFLNG
ncbi:Gpr1p NDAI_0A06690 [Naumovozyma dairenensis CBS 421]|uniref:G-protein coupled receptors family 1 profile domain-containing protein n=1 Tax=Naumovozyma dairenensis (strain ATCC 10597 / BCRC 20456 / CBS 421 / NBRC 0211 / NRRL Y-12639) TaxID=1071378 RepID=G0W4T5_NAUDC|nr:hypothetical protein NDAI_0A06690 [Naumovozyma dairenensis CBS 421]CCD22823.1 hypothetical protein NDAI_0A06690 [Naumovozyma dairenensis CBS 421]